MPVIEIPLEKDRHGWYRVFEILPGFLSYLVLLLPLILSLFSVTAAAIFILGYILVFFARTVAYELRVMAGFRTMRKQLKLNWRLMTDELEAGEESEQSYFRPQWHLDNLKRLPQLKKLVKPSELYHAVIIAVYKEGREIVEPTLRSLVDAEFDSKQLIVLLAYEERGGEAAEHLVNQLVSEFGRHFKHMEAVKHPKNMPNELIGKGGNITFAGRRLEQYLKSQQVDPYYVVVTTLDADNRPHKLYFLVLTYMFCVSPDPVQVSYQPLPMFTNNIWDVPAPMRAIATGNNFFYLVLTQRPHLERNFSAHAQSMRALIDMDFWSVRTIVEDGHQFWRSYFFFNGNYRVYPMSVPVYQDAVLAEGYIKTLKAQFIQLRRWTYGASDIAYITYNGFFRRNSIPKRDLIPKLLRAIEGHVTWATGPVLLLLSGFIPALLHPQSYTANTLPLIISRIQRIGLVGLAASVFVAVKTLPPRPARYKRHRSVIVFFQWIFLLFTPLIYGSTAALYSQTRLMLRKYMSKFDTTEKSVVGVEKT